MGIKEDESRLGWDCKSKARSNKWDRRILVEGVWKICSLQGEDKTIPWPVD